MSVSYTFMYKVLTVRYLYVRFLMLLLIQQSIDVSVLMKTLKHVDLQCYVTYAYSFIC